MVAAVGSVLERACLEVVGVDCRGWPGSTAAVGAEGCCFGTSIVGSVGLVMLSSVGETVGT